MTMESKKKENDFSSTEFQTWLKTLNQTIEEDKNLTGEELEAKYKVFSNGWD